MIKPWFLLPAGLAHKVSPFLLNAIYPWIKDPQPHWNSVQWKGLNFRNPVGVAGGVDKNGRNAKAWSELGYGFIEIGTITPEPQGPNPGLVVARDLSKKAIWNKLGFPNDGAKIIRKRLEKIRSQVPVPLFINIGKNRTTNNQNAVKDYQVLIEEFNSLADVFVVNISSPNTSGLRELLSKSSLESFLSPVVSSTPTPILLKLSPDMADEDIDNVIEVSERIPLAGWILTNSTVGREQNDSFPEGGGITGEPLRLKSRHCLERFMKRLGPNKGNRLVVSVGGILSREEMDIRIKLGADLVQVYSGLIFSGPDFVKKLRTNQT